MANITYYKLKDGIYEGDVTKGCGLTGIEVDQNFKFLEDRIVERVDITDENRIRIVFRNGLCAETENPIPHDISYNLSFDFDEDRGVLRIDNNGRITEIPGFPSKCGRGIRTDASISGNGECSNPLGISRLHRSGMARYVMDVVDVDGLPDKPKKGERYLVMEPASRYGALYGYDDVERLSRMLRCTPWRIPTKRDWDCMLNEIEECSEECRNHDDEFEGEKGCMAGCALKLSPEWNYENYCGNKYGFSVLPSGHIDNHGNFVNFKGDANEECAYFWTADKNDRDGNAYAKIFSNKYDGVFQEVIRMDNRCSLRLVRDFDGGDCNPTEEILGIETGTVVMDSCDGGRSVWTSENIYYSDSAIRPTIPDEYRSEGEYAYYTYEWDGSEWDRRMLERGEGIYVYNSRETYIYTIDNRLEPMSATMLWERYNPENQQSNNR